VVPEQGAGEPELVVGDDEVAVGVQLLPAEVKLFADGTGKVESHAFFPT
jgi:hypothetical protein